MIRPDVCSTSVFVTQLSPKKNKKWRINILSSPDLEKHMYKKRGTYVFLLYKEYRKREVI